MFCLIPRSINFILLLACLSLPAASVPTITSFTPTSGIAGTQITLTGTNFTGATSVKFNGTAASSYTVSGATKITAVAPNGVTTGKVSVTTSGGTATSSSSFTVAAPTITSFIPTSGIAGTQITLTGTNFTGATSVKFNGKAASSYTVSSATKITAVAPNGVTTGKVSVTTSGGTATSSSSFTVAAPTITSFTPTSGIAGIQITLTGTNFTGATSVKFNGTAASGYTVNSATSLTAVVPTGATTGKVSVTTAGGTATSSTSFTVRLPPTITTQPSSKSVNLGSTATFTVVASGTATLSYQWSKNGTEIPGATAASYTTPAAVAGDNGAAFTVKVTNPFGSVTSSAATLTILVKVTVSPTSATMDQGAQQSFTATVTGSSNTSVTWTSSATNAITQGGVFTAPNAAGSYTVTATSTVDGTTKGTATVTVRAVTIGAIQTSPSSSALPVGDQLQCWVTVTGTVDTRVTWTVLSGGGNFDYSGSYNPRYTPPPTPGTATIQATCVADPTKTATATITIVDNGGRPLFTSAAISPSQVKLGQNFTLSWNISNADSVWLYDELGNSFNVTGQSSLSLRVADYIDHGEGLLWVSLEAINAVGSSERLLRVQASEPWVDSLDVSPQLVNSGESVTVLPVFSGGTGRIEPSQGTISTGVQTSVLALGTPDQRVVVENELGAKAEQELGAALRAPRGNLQSSGNLPFVFMPTDQVNGDQERCRVVPLLDGTVAAIGIVDWTSRALHAVRYDPATGAFSNLATLQRRESAQVIRLADGKLLFSGLTESEVLDPTTGAISHPSYGWLAQQFTATLLADGNVLFAGGEDIWRDQYGSLWPGTQTSSAYVWVPGEDRKITLPYMVHPRSHHSAIRMMDGRVLIVGSYKYGVAPVLECEIFDPVSQTFSPTGSLHKLETMRPTLSLMPDGKVLVFGSDTEVYDPTTGLFTVLSPNTPWADLMAPPVHLGDGLFLSGWTDAKGTLFDPVGKNYFELDGPEDVPMASGPAAPLTDGRVLWAGVGRTTDQGAYQYDGSVLLDPQAPVSVQPARSYIHAGQTVSFAATFVSGSLASWSVYPTDATISPVGQFRAARPGTYAITATATDGRKGYAWVEVLPLIQNLVLTPTNSSIAGSGVVTFTATDSGSPVQAVWSASVGTIDSNGVYTAPSSACTATITAFRADDQTRGGSTAIKVVAPPGIASFTASSIAVPPGQPVILSWSVSGATSLILNPGNQNVLYQSTIVVTPSVTTTYTLTAQNSQGNTTRSLTVVASSVMSITISPSTGSLIAGTSMGFAVNQVVANGADPTVSWKVNESDGGTVVPSGENNLQAIYTAPTVPGNYTLTVYSVADPSRSATAVISVLKPTVALTITPGLVTLSSKAATRFGYSISSSNNDVRVLWRVNEGEAGGTIDSSGNYTAPAVPGNYTVSIQSEADPLVVATSTVTVLPVSISVNPPSITLAPGEVVQLGGSIQVQGIGTTDVLWGTSEGLLATVEPLSVRYTAPDHPGVFQVTLTSMLDSNAKATAICTVDASRTPSFTINPSTLWLSPGGQWSFSALMGSQIVSDPLWSVDSTTEGIVDSTGHYIAPTQPGLYHITATDRGQGLVATATVSVGILTLSPTAKLLPPGPKFHME